MFGGADCPALCRQSSSRAHASTRPIAQGVKKGDPFKIINNGQPRPLVETKRLELTWRVGHRRLGWQPNYRTFACQRAAEARRLGQCQHVAAPWTLFHPGKSGCTCSCAESIQSIGHACVRARAPVDLFSFQTLFAPPGCSIKNISAGMISRERQERVRDRGAEEPLEQRKEWEDKYGITKLDIEALQRVFKATGHNGTRKDRARRSCARL